MDRWARRTFLSALVVALALFLWTIKAFLLPVFLGAVLVVLCLPMHGAIRARLPRRPALAALASTLVVFLVIVAPLAFAAVALAREVVSFAEQIRDSLARGGAEQLADTLRTTLDRLPGAPRIDVPPIGELLERAAGTAASWAGRSAGNIAATAGSFGINVFLTFVACYYLFLDGPRLLTRLDGLLPLEVRYERELFIEFRNTIVAVLYGTGIVGLVQGALLGVAFSLAGVPNAMLWAAMAVLTAFVPLLGSGLVWVPVSLAMLLSGEPWRALFILAWGALVVGTVDNFLRPLLVKGRIRVHSLVVFLTIFGGLAAFGAVGVVLGPVIGSLTMALLRIWERDFVVPHRAVTHAVPTQPATRAALAELARPPPARHDTHPSGDGSTGQTRL